MADDLLTYYDRELAAIRKLAGEFAAANPKVAGRLRIAGDAVDDPHVERLLQGVAFLAARVQHRLDDELPELTDTLLELLCPHLLAPVPSMTTVRLVPPPEANGPARVPRGTRLHTETVQGEVLQYQTCHETVLWPVRIEQATLTGLPVAAPVNPQAHRAAAVLRLVLATTVPDLTFAMLGLDRLRIHLRGPGPIAAQLIELLCTSTLSIALAESASDSLPHLLPPTSLCHAGFDPGESALPWPQRAFLGHRLLTEFFAFPDKFHYVDLSNLEGKTLLQNSGRLEIYVYLSRGAGAIERNVSAENFVLGCTPAVNLFRQAAEPIALDGTRAEWLVVPDARRPAALEVFSVEGVRLSRPDDPLPRKVPHFQRMRGSDGPDGVAGQFSWLASRHFSPAGSTEMHLALRDAAFDPTRPADGVLSVDTLCCNRDLPSLLPFGGGHPVLRIADATAPAAGAECLSPPTPTLRPRLRERSAWRLISHLALNHLGVTGGPESALALREMMRLHDFRDAPETRLALEGLVSVTATPGVARIPGLRPGSFARGLDVALVFDPHAWTAGGLFLLCGVLDRFLALQVSVNGFIRLSAHLRGRPGSITAWPARSGTRILL